MKPRDEVLNNCTSGNAELVQDRQTSDAQPPSGWSNILQSFAYPAAIFYGEQMILFCNKPWAETSAVRGQGQAQRGNLSTEVWDALTAALHGGKPKRVYWQGFLPPGARAHIYHQVLLSPLFDDSCSDQAAAILAQLLPDPQVDQNDIEDDTGIHSKGDQLRMKGPPSTRSTIVDETNHVPLDEHPFFHRFAEMLPTGLAILNPQAEAVFVNQHFRELTTHHNEDQSFASWPRSIHPDDYDRVITDYREAFRSQTELRTEFRSIGHRHAWRLLLLTPLAEEDLQHFSLHKDGGFICSIVDISSEKSAALAERGAAEEARERKVQQERFIDMISHEIRNPLSAILHCTEEIETAIEQESTQIDADSIRQATETINLCIAHQRNIVDDVLSYSKLDAAMLSLTPKPCKPAPEIADLLKMFQPEFRKQAMEYDYCIDTSYVDVAVNWAMADLARIGQVLVNLVSNAIKFTAASSGEKSVRVSIGACVERPTSYPPNVVFFDAEDSVYQMDATNTTEWGNGPHLYLLVAVKDTGIGISEEGQKRLFERFRQATPKTGEEYGGSGLGLNISRKLCHLHGGEIGVASVEGQGSTFGFFFKVKRTESPSDESQAFNDAEDEAKEKVEEQIEENGLASPQEMDESMMPPSLDRTPVIETKDFPGNGVEHDSRYWQTAKVASQVKIEDSDHHLEPEYLSIANETGSHDEAASPAGAANGTSDSALPAHRKTHVLLAEDNIVNQRIVFRKLQSQGYNVTTANHGGEAVNFLLEAHDDVHFKNGAFDIVLMDQEMPVMDGNAATKRIRELEQDGKLNRVAILGVTANVREQQQSEMIESGMDEVVSKPYKMGELIAKMEKLLKSNGG